MKSKIPVFEFLIDESDESGVKTISLVTDPAMKSTFIAFNKQDVKPKYIFIDKDEKKYKGIVAGLAMIPEKMIGRVDDNGAEYEGYFSIETIEKIRNKYHKEVMNLQSVNLEHSDAFIDAYLIESYLLDTEERVAEVKSKGIEEAVIGAWYTAFKVENKEVFNACIDGTFNGFSVEAFLERELKMSTNNFNNKKIKKMKKNLLERLKMRVNKILDEVNFEESLVPDLNVTISWDEVGGDVTKTYINDEELEVIEPIGVGEFIVEDGRTVVVDENSMLVEVRDAVVEEEVLVDEIVEEVDPVSGDTVVEEEELEVVVDETIVNEPAPVTGDTASGDTVVVEELVEEVVEEVPVSDVASKTLAELIDVTKDGSYSISVTVLDGVITEANVSAEQNLITQELSDKIKELEVKLAEPIADPKLVDVKTPVGEVKELTVYETIAKRKGLDVV